MNEFDMLAAAETARSGELPQNFWDDLSSGWRFRKEELAWPVDEKGEKEKAVLLTSTFDSPAESDVTISFLISCGIPCFKYYAKEGGAGKVISGFSGYGADLYVPASRLEEARALLQAEPVFDEDGMILSGVIVRHLLLPGGREDSLAVVRYLYETYGDSIYMSLMKQYTPLLHDGRYPELERKLRRKEYDRVVEYALEIGVQNAYIPEGGTARESFIPVFDGTGLIREK